MAHLLREHSLVSKPTDMAVYHLRATAFRQFAMTPGNWHANVCTPGTIFGVVIDYGGEGEFANHLG